ncbi:MAG TPA: hypothetical protein VI603_09635 [Saprospiraceae bacterium]|nr:hypothetical protein [Saprospiraceae bacterium]
MKTQFIVDDNGNKLAVILPMKEYEKMIEELEELEDIKLYDDAVKEDDGERILVADYASKRKLKNG